ANLFFFQAEDGIRDRNVTGVQTCALPICAVRWWSSKIPIIQKIITTQINARLPMPFRYSLKMAAVPIKSLSNTRLAISAAAQKRSEERRVGKERRTEAAQSEER